MSRHADRQALARRFGATDIVEERGSAGVARIRELTAGVEQPLAVERHVVRDADVADVSAGAGRADRLRHRLLRADGFDRRVRLGAERIIAMSRHADRQALARRFGATDIVEERGSAAVLPGPASAATAANQPVPSTSEAASSEGIRSGSG
jgi:Zn-dependent alcohol dehydrogenase